jgi:archaeal flagellar protein FlaI
MKKLPELPEKEKTIFKLDISTEIPNFPNVKKNKINFKYPLIAPYAYAHIFWDSKSQELIYNLEEPKLSVEEKKVLNLLEEGIKELINISYLKLGKKDTIISYLERNLKILLSELGITLTKESYLRIMYYIYRDFVGLNKIEPLMNDMYIEDIECNGANHPLYVVHRKYRNIRTNVIFNKIKNLTSFVEKLAQKSGQYISYATPLLDGALPDGSRVNATFTKDISSRGPTFTIRKFTSKPWTPTQLLYLNTVSADILAYLWTLIKYERNIMVVGGTGSGKTTFLNGLTFFIPPQARIVSIEDTRELNLEHSNWLPTVARAGVGLANLVGQKYGEVTLFNLLKESFRMNPDYVIIGEIRGEEAYVLFQGMSSGHPSFGTMHANSVDSMIKRLVTPPINLSSSLVEVMDVVVVMTQSKVDGKPVRRVREVVEIVKIDEKGNGATINKPFVWNPSNDSFEYTSESHVFKKISLEQGILFEKLRSEFERKRNFLIGMYNKSVFDFHEVQSMINLYYKNSNEALSKIGV